LGVPGRVLRDIAALDWAYVETFETPIEKGEKILKISDLSAISPESWETITFTPTQAFKIIDLEWDIGPVWKSINEGEDPEKPIQENCSYLIWQKKGHLQNQKISEIKKIFLNFLKAGKTFKESTLKAQISPEEGALLLSDCISDEILTNSQLW
jgi:hypothetical protein